MTQPRVVQPRVVVLGSINMDLTASVDRLPGPGETVLGADLVRQPGGKGANQAAALARLTGTATMIGAVGEDPDGESVLAALGAAGVDVQHVRRLPEVATGTALIAVDGQGENQIIVCPGANARVALPASGVPETDALLAQLEIDLELVLSAATATDAFVALNASPARPLPSALVDRCDLAVVNETEYALMPELRDARLVCVTSGAAGAALLERGRELVRVPAAPTEVVSTVGAGDAFCAALVAGLAARLAPEEALRVAAAVAADAVAQPESQPRLDRFDAYRQRVAAG